MMNYKTCMMISRYTKYAGKALLLGIITAQQVSAAIALDRTRVIFNDTDPSVALSINNQNKDLPYLAQAWIEDANGKKIESPLMVLPPLQRIDAGEKSQVKIQPTSGLNMLAQDRETLFYFNLREIPPKPGKPNTLQIALQTRIKLFYRPALISNMREKQDDLPHLKLTLMRQGGRYVVSNPTPFYVTIAGVRADELSKDSLQGFTPVMIPPKSSTTLAVSAGDLGLHPVLTYINDYGGRPTLTFGCDKNLCTVKSSKAG